MALRIPFSKDDGFLREDTLLMGSLSEATPVLTSANPPEKKRFFVFFVGDGTSLEGAPGELLSRMIVAMGLTSQNTHVMEKAAPDASFSEASALVFLGGHRTSGIAPEIPVIETHHPSELILNPALKKETWEALKGLVHTLGLEIPGTQRGSVPVHSGSG